jgi:Skp family chaperone for outer membrane proteins
MIRNTLSIVVVLTLFASIAHARQAQPTKVGTVNPAKVFDQIQETKDLRAKMEQERLQIGALQNEKRARIKSAEEARNVLAPGSPAFEEKNRELMQLAVDFEVWSRMTQIQLERNQKLLMKNVYDKIVAAVPEVAQRRGVDLVLAENRPELGDAIEQLDLNAVRALITSRNVLFSRAEIDLTADVIVAMDNAYKSGK